MLKQRHALNPYLGIAIEILRDSENKARDLIFCYATVVSNLNSKDEYEGQAGNSRQRRDGGKAKK